MINGKWHQVSVKGRKQGVVGTNYIALVRLKGTSIAKSLEFLKSQNFYLVSLAQKW